MSKRRKSDSEFKQWFRSDRFFQNERKWYFDTREGSVQGPFENKSEAQYSLEKYVKMVEAAVLPNEKGGLRLEPLHATTGYGGNNGFSG